MVLMFGFDMGLSALETALLGCRLWFSVMHYKVPLYACVYIHVHTCIHSKPEIYELIRN
jgi:hypothetical protein